jgi:formylmethanofuran dehydrogenase subunit E
MEREKAQEYSSYQQIYQTKHKERKAYIQQLELLRSYLGCSNCKSLAVDAYELYEKSRLVCQPCLIRKEGRSSSPISFSGKSK